MLAKIESALQLVESKVNKPICILLGIIIGYVSHPVLQIALDIALIPLKLLKLI